MRAPQKFVFGDRSYLLLIPPYPWIIYFSSTLLYQQQKKTVAIKETTQRRNILWWWLLPTNYWHVPHFLWQSSYWYCELMFFLWFQPETIQKSQAFSMEFKHVHVLIISFGIQNFFYVFCQASFWQLLMICPRLS